MTLFYIKLNQSPPSKCNLAPPPILCNYLLLSYYTTKYQCLKHEQHCVWTHTYTRKNYTGRFQWSKSGASLNVKIEHRLLKGAKTLTIQLFGIYFNTIIRLIQTFRVFVPTLTQTLNWLRLNKVCELDIRIPRFWMYEVVKFMISIFLGTFNGLGIRSNLQSISHVEAGTIILYEYILLIHL